MTQNKSSIILAIILLIGIFLRFYLSPINNKGDVYVHQDWAKILYQQGIRGSYFFQNWTYSPPTQPPLMMLGFWTSHYLFVHRYVLAKIHNITHFPPADFLIWLDTNGEFLLLKLWSFLADIMAGIFIYYFIKKITKKNSISLIATSLYYLNPIILFETALWGQNDTLGMLFSTLAILLVNFSSFLPLTPVLFLIGLMTKPTVLILIPIFTFLYFYQLLQQNSKKRLIYLGFSLVSCLILTTIMFFPFVSKSTIFQDIYTIITQRIAPNSKGVIRASNSALNFYSLFFQIDHTSGNTLFLKISLTAWGYLFYILLNLFSIFLFLKSKIKSKHLPILSIIYIISQGSFLFMTGMLERYFFPAFMASILLLVLNFKNYGYLFILQNILWFINLYYSFFLRDSGFLRLAFSSNNFLLVRLFSLMSIFTYILIVRRLTIDILRKPFNSKKHQI